MSVVSLLGVNVLKNPAPFSAPYEFEITFECLEQLQKDIEWKLTYVGSATSSEHDQELDSLLVGPIPVGTNKFIFEADPPDLKRIPSSDILGVTVILLTCSYDGREFVRVGYYQNNEYDSEEMNNEPPARTAVERVRRNVLAEKPRVTRFTIKWDSEESAPAAYPPDQPEADLLEDDGAAYGAEEEEEEEDEAEVEGLSKPVEEDAEMGGAEDTSGPPGEPAMATGRGAGTSRKANGGGGEDDDDVEAGSEDLDDETSGSEDEDGEEDEGEGDADEEMADDDVEMGDVVNHGAATEHDAIQQQQQHGGRNGKQAVEVH